MTFQKKNCQPYKDQKPRGLHVPRHVILDHSLRISALYLHFFVFESCFMAFDLFGLCYVCIQCWRTQNNLTI